MRSPLATTTLRCPRSRPRLGNTRHRARLGHPRSVTLDYDVRVADRHRDRTPRIAPDIASLPRARARLEPERAVEPQGTDRGHMRAAVLVDGGQPGRAGVHRVRNWRRPRIELAGNRGPVHRRQPIRLTQIDDLHKASLHCPADIPANSIWQIRRATAHGSHPLQSRRATGRSNWTRGKGTHKMIMLDGAHRVPDPSDFDRYAEEHVRTCTQAGIRSRGASGEARP